MSIALLIETQNEVRRLLIAGSELSSGDFRLKKLMRQMMKAGENAPIFARVADTMGKVIEPEGEKSSEKLLELATIINAVLYTQGQTGMDGEIKEADPAGLDLPTSISFRCLQPVIEALTSKGAGRLEIIKEAYKEGLFKDLRLVSPLIYALNDNYSDIAEVVMEIIIEYGAAIIPVLKSDFDFKGGKGYARRVDIISRLAGRNEKEFILKALEEGIDEVKVSAVKALKDFPEYESLLLELSKDRKKEIREASLLSLAGLSSEAAVKRLFEVFNSKERSIAMYPVKVSSSKSITKMLLSEAEQALEEILKSEKGFSLFNKKVVPLSNEVNDNFAVILECMEGKKDEEIFEFLKKCLEHTKHLEQMKVNKTQVYRVEDTLAGMVGRGLILFGTEKALRLLDSVQGKYNNCLLSYSFEAALRIKDEGYVFNHYAGYVKSGRKSFEGQEVLGIMDGYVDFDLEYRLTDVYLYNTGNARISRNVRDQIIWDPRWTKVLADIDETRLVCRLASRNDTRCTEYLLKKLGDNMNFNDRFQNDIIKGLMQAQYLNIIDVIIKILDHNFKKSGQNIGYYFNNFTKVLRLLPSECANALENFAEGIDNESCGKIYEVAHYIKTK